MDERVSKELLEYIKSLNLPIGKWYEISFCFSSEDEICITMPSCVIYQESNSDLTLWKRIEYMTFGTEQAARASLVAILEFCNKDGIKRIIDDVEINHD